MTAAIATLSQGGGIGNTSTVDQRFDFRSESLTLIEDVVNGNGVRGTRSHSVERLRAGLRRIGGGIELQPSAVEWAYFLQWILGGGNATVPALADTLPSRYVVFDRITKVFTYSGCKVDRATIRATQGNLVSLSLDIVGMNETVGNSGSFPANLTLDTTTTPFYFGDLAITVGGTTLTPKDFTLTINNAIDRNRFFNSQELVSVETWDRSITFSTMLPYGDFSAIYGSGSPPGAVMNATFTNGNVSLAFNAPALVFMRDSPNIDGRTEIMLPVSGRLYKSGSTAELLCSLDSSP